MIASSNHIGKGQRTNPKLATALAGIYLATAPHPSPARGAHGNQQQQSAFYAQSAHGCREACGVRAACPLSTLRSAATEDGLPLFDVPGFCRFVRGRLCSGDELAVRSKS